MDALSSIKFALPPDMGIGQAGQAGKTLPDFPVPQNIPLPEMDALKSANAAQPLQSIDGSQPAYSFQNLLGNFVNEVSQKQAAAGDAVSGLLSGQNVPLHQAVISMEEASVSFQMMVEVRNKLLESYQELMRMQM